jgi:glutathione S-transferase
MAEEIGRPYEHVPIEPRDAKTSEFLAVSPNGHVPTIEDDGFALSESMAINLYLAKKYVPALHPRTREDEARAWQWSFWAVTEVEKPIIDWALQEFGLPTEQREPEKARAARQALEAPLGVLEATLAKSPCLLGAEFTVADLNVASVMYRALWMDLVEKPRTAEWLTTSWARPAARRARALREP